MCMICGWSTCNVTLQHHLWFPHSYTPTHTRPLIHTHSYTPTHLTPPTRMKSMKPNNSFAPSPPPPPASSPWAAPSTPCLPHTHVQGSMIVSPPSFLPCPPWDCNPTAKLTIRWWLRVWAVDTGWMPSTRWSDCVMGVGSMGLCRLLRLLQWCSIRCDVQWLVRVFAWGGVCGRGGGVCRCVGMVYNSNNIHLHFLF